MGNLATAPAIKTSGMSSLIDIESYQGELIIQANPRRSSYLIGKVYETAPLTGGGGEFASVVENLFKGLPDGSILQCNELCYPDHSVAERFLRGKVSDNPVIQSLIQHQAELFAAAVGEASLPESPLLNVKTVLIAFMVPCGQTDFRTLEAMTQLQDGFLTSLCHSGFALAKALSPGALAGRYRQFTRMYFPWAPVELDPLVEFKEQIFGPRDDLDFTERSIGCFQGESYCAGVAIKHYPHEADMGLMNLVIGAPLQSNKGTKSGGGTRILTPFIINTTLRIANQDEEQKRVQRAIDSRRHSQATFERLFGFGYESSADKLKDLQYLRENCSRDENKYVYASTNIFLFANDRVLLKTEQKKLKDRLDVLDFAAREVGHDLLPRFANALPMNYSPHMLKGECLMTASAAATLLPIYGDWQGNAYHGNRSGVMFVTRRGQPHAFDVSYSQGAFNGYVYGDTGRGKSATMLYLILCELAQGTMVVFFDNSQTGLGLCKAVHGDFLAFTPDCDLTYSLNPFAGVSVKDFEDFECENIVRLLLLMAYEDGITDEFAGIVMREAVTSAFHHNPMGASIEMVIDSLEQSATQHPLGDRDSKLYQATSNLVPRLKSFMNNQSRSRFFIGNKPLNPSAQFTVFDLKGLDADPHLRRVVMFFLMNISKSKMAKFPGRKLQIVDEAKDVLKVKTEAEAFEGQYAKGRKEGVSTWVITQSPEDLDGKMHDNPCLDKIRSQSDFSILLGLKPNEVEYAFNQNLINKNFASDPYYRTVLSDLSNVKGKYSELLITTDQNYEVVRVYLHKVLLWLFNSNKEHRDVVFPLLDQGRHPLEVYDQLENQGRQQRMRWIGEFVDNLVGDGLVNKKDLLKEFQQVLDNRS